MNTTRPLSGRGKEINYWFHSLPLGTVGPVANFRECHESLCWGHAGAFSAFRLEPSLQRLWRSGTRLLVGWGFGTRIVGNSVPVASDFDWISSPCSNGFRFGA